MGDAKDAPHVLFTMKGEDSIVHWRYPHIERLSVCGWIAPLVANTQRTTNHPTCLRCIAIVMRNAEWGPA